MHVSYFFDHLSFIPDSFENLLIINNSFLEFSLWLLEEFKWILVDVGESAGSIGFVLGTGNVNLALDEGHREFNCWELDSILTVDVVNGNPGKCCCWYDDCKCWNTDVWKVDVDCVSMVCDNGENCFDKSESCWYSDDRQLDMAVLEHNVDNTSGNVSSISIFVLKLLLLDG